MMVNTTVDNSRREIFAITSHLNHFRKPRRSKNSVTESLATAMQRNSTNSPMKMNFRASTAFSNSRYWMCLPIPYPTPTVAKLIFMMVIN